MAVLDHLVHAVADLDDGRRWFARHTGVEPATGGSHPGRGTHNALASFGAGYVELIAPDPGQPTPPVARPFGLDRLAGPGLVAVAIRPDPGDSIDALVERARAAGHDPGRPEAMSRRQPDGRELHWRLTFPIAGEPAVPFVIDWGTTLMPSATAPGGLELADLTLTSPAPGAVRAALAALGVDLTVAAGASSGATAVIRGPSGSVVLEPAPTVRP